MDHETRSSDTHRMNASACGACSVWTLRAVMRVRIGNYPRGRCTITTVARSDKNGLPAAWLVFFHLYMARGLDVMFLCSPSCDIIKLDRHFMRSKNELGLENIWPVLELRIKGATAHQAANKLRASYRHSGIK